MSVFDVLSKVDVNEHVEQKNSLTYLTWAWAWAELKKAFPDANFTIYETPEGVNYFTDGRTAWVKVGVRVEKDGIEIVEQLPVMDFKNKSIPLEALTSTDVNKAIKRCLVKAIAMHGLGLYIYAGEDLPEEKTAAVKKTDVDRLLTDEEFYEFMHLVEDYGLDLAGLMKRYNVSNPQNFTITHYKDFKKKVTEIKEENK